jgi:hypothetical protein
MPRGDGTGPLGMGPMSGRAAGYCAGYSVPGYAHPGAGRGYGFWGRGRGGGRGWRNRFYATGLTGWQRAAFGWPGSGAPYAPHTAGPATAEEVELLKQQAEGMEKALAEVRKRIDELQADPDAE